MIKRIEAALANVDLCKNAVGNLNHEVIAHVPELVNIISDLLAMDLEQFALLKAQKEIQND